MTTKPTPKTVNGIDLEAVGAEVDAIAADASLGQAHFDVETTWAGQVRSKTRTKMLRVGGEEIERRHVIEADEPNELLGSDTGPNPQELILAALNACMTVGFVSGCAAEGIALESLVIRTKCDLDLRGFLALDDDVPAGAPRWNTQVEVRGDGTPEQFAAILHHVKNTSPNFFHVVEAIEVETDLIVG